MECMRGSDRADFIFGWHHYENDSSFHHRGLRAINFLLYFSKHACYDPFICIYIRARSMSSCMVFLFALVYILEVQSMHNGDATTATVIVGTAHFHIHHSTKSLSQTKSKTEWAQIWNASKLCVHYTHTTSISILYKHNVVQYIHLKCNGAPI